MKNLEKVGILFMIIIVLVIIIDTIKSINFNKQILTEGVNEIIKEEEANIKKVDPRLNMILNYNGYPEEKILIKKILQNETGIRLENTTTFDETTKNALKVFQKLKKIPVTGKLDRNTKIELCKSLLILNEE